MAEDTVPTIDEDKLNSLGQKLFGIWPTYVTDRRMIEERWLRNLRQVRKIYDPEVLNMIPSDRSKAYPGMTQWMVRGTIARLMQMLFPQTEKNYGIKPSPLPDLTKEQLQKVLDTLVKVKAEAAQSDPTQVQLSDEDIEKAMLAFAKGKAENMETKIDDDLQGMDYVTLIRKVVRSAVIYNIGVLKGPLHRKVPARKWQKNQFTGAYEALETEKYKPLYEFVPVWNYYPDMTAVSLDKQDGTFERNIMTRAQVEELADRADFLGDRISDYLVKNINGNYKAQWWESVIKGEPKSGTAPVATKESRKYEVLSYWGAISGHDLRAAGVEIKDEEVGKSFHANVWMIDALVIKAKLAPFGDTIRHYHEFVFEDDDLSILGNGQCDVLRDSQLSICETARAALDNMSVIGPAVELNMDLLTPGQDMSIRKHKTWFREGDGNQANTPAVRNINIESHLTELTGLLNMFMSFAEKESGLPPPSLGDVSGGGSEALRTQRGASMFLGAAALPIRDTVRNYDTFTVSVISALVEWNMKFDPMPMRDGDHDIIARGSTSLIAKEVLAGNLNEFRASITPDEAPHVNFRKLLMARAKANDLPLDDLLEDEDVANQKLQQQSQAAQQQSQDQAQLVQAQIKELLTRGLEHEAKAQSEGAKVGVSVFQVLLDAIAGGHEAQAAHAVAAASAITKGHEAVSKRIAAEKPTGGGK